MTISMGREPPGGPARAERYCVGVRRTSPLQVHPSRPREERPDAWARIPVAPGGAEGPPVIATRAALDCCSGVTLGVDVTVVGEGGEEVITDRTGLRALTAATWAGGNAICLPDRRRVELRRGPGGSYLSNEVAYRVQRAIGTRPRPLSFHLHTPMGLPADDAVTRATLRDRLVEDVIRLSRELLGPCVTSRGPDGAEARARRRAPDARWSAG